MGFQWDGCQELKEYVVGLRREFHQSPEISEEEVNTSKRVQKELDSLGIAYEVFPNHYGIIGKIENGAGPVIALRADMDALSVVEETGLPFESCNSGKMHACGHDGHMSMLLGAAKLLLQNKDQWQGTVKLLFQPAEELAPKGGAHYLIESGALEGVDYIFGCHVWPDLEAGSVGIRKGYLMASSDRFWVTLKGKASHAALPHQGVDAIVMAAEAIQQIYMVRARQMDPIAPVTVNVGVIQGGSRYNVVPGEVKLEGTVRTLDAEMRNLYPVRLKRQLEHLALGYGGEAMLDYQFGYPPLNNNDGAVDIFAEAALEVLDQEKIDLNVKPALPAEDFSFFLEKCPGAYFWLGCKKEGSGALHNGTFDMNEEILPLSATLLFQTAKKALNKVKE